MLCSFRHFLVVSEMRIRNNKQYLLKTSPFTNCLVCRCHFALASSLQPTNEAETSEQLFSELSGKVMLFKNKTRHWILFREKSIFFLLYEVIINLSLFKPSVGCDTGKSSKNIILSTFSELSLFHCFRWFFLLRNSALSLTEDYFYCVYIPYWHWLFFSASAVAIQACGLS